MTFREILDLGDFVTFLVLTAVQVGLLALALLAMTSAVTGWF
jgi:heme exporter protein D